MRARRRTPRARVGAENDGSTVVRNALRPEFVRPYRLHGNVAVGRPESGAHGLASQEPGLFHARPASDFRTSRRAARRPDRGPDPSGDGVVRALGLMSGTSLDGIDVADVAVTRTGDRLSARLDHFATIPIGDGLRSGIVQALPPSDGSTACVAELNVALGEAFASAVLAAVRAWNVDLSCVDVIGSHGQTVYHAPEDCVTLQVGEPAVIAARTGVTCVADFRVADAAAGGQGAPLVPFVDRHLFASSVEYRVALNIGGIANLTLLPAGGGSESVRAFDSGPGNMVIDECMRLATNGRLRFDRDGDVARHGSVNDALLDELLADPFFAQPGPKSTGRERYGAAYAARVRERGGALGP